MPTPQGVLLGRRTLITGASQGIGAAIAEAFGAAGSDLVLAGRNRTALQDQARLLGEQHGVRAEVLVVDLAEADAAERLAAAAWSTYGGLDVLVNNAGISFPELAGDLSADKLDAVLDVNLRAPMLLAARVGAAMAAAGSGSIISVASTAGLRALSEHYTYCASKAGLIMATKVLALELGPSGVRANSLCPTVTLTEMGQKVWLDHPEKAAPMLERIPLRRFVYPDEVAATAVWLASDAASMVNGTELMVDGGFLVT